jgi:hypothetical protein
VSAISLECSLRSTNSYVRLSRPCAADDEGRHAPFVSWDVVRAGANIALTCVPLRQTVAWMIVWWPAMVVRSDK